MNRLYGRLASINIRNNYRFYLPYLLTGTLSAAMFYLVLAMQGNPGLKDIKGGAEIALTLGLGVVVIGVFVSIFLFYTNSFIIKRRKKELGVYNILGMEKKHIAKVLFLETLFTAVVSISGGLAFGIVFHKFLAMMLYRLMRIEQSIPFYISSSACVNTVKLFLLIYGAAFCYNLMQIKLANPIALLHGSNAGEREPKTKILMTLAGLVTLGAGYYIALTVKDAMNAILMFFVAVLLVIAGTYCLFTAGSIALLKLLRKNKQYYYHARHFTMVSGMIYRMKQNAVGLANICILSTMVLVMVSTTTSLMAGMEDIIRDRYPADFVFYFDGEKEEAQGTAEAICRLREQSGLRLEKEWEYTYVAFQAIREGDSYAVYRERARSVEDDTNSLFFVTLDDYNAVTGEQKQLGEGEILIYSNRQAFDFPELKIFGKEYRVAEKLDGFVGNGEYEALMSATQYIVVPDRETLDELNREQKSILTDLASDIQWVYGFDLKAGGEEQEAFQEILMQQLASAGGFKLETKVDGRVSFLEIYGGLFFIGIFLGILFIMATVLIIYYKQISEGYDDKNRFEIMQKVGMSRSEVKAAIHSQVLTVFFLPLVVAGIHVAAAFSLISRLLAMMNLYNIKLFAACTVSCFMVFAVMYVLIYVLTAKTYYRIVSR